MYIRLVLPVEQTTAIARSILERGKKPNVTLIDIELKRMKQKRQRTKRSRQDPTTRTSKKKKKKTPLGEATTVPKRSKAMHPPNTAVKVIPHEI